MTTSRLAGESFRWRRLLSMLSASRARFALRPQRDMSWGGQSTNHL